MTDEHYKFKMAKNACGKGSREYQTAKAIAQLLSIAQNTLTSNEQLEGLCVEHEIGSLLTNDERASVVKRAASYLHRLEEDFKDYGPKKIDFDDMLWIPVKCKLPIPAAHIGYDWIIIDEVQDFNTVQLKLLEILLQSNTNARIIAAGDGRQSIYSFRGAFKTLEKLRAQLGPANITEFTLPVCRRCPPSHLNLVKPIVPYIRPLEDKVGAALNTMDYYAAKDSYAKGDTILARATKPLILLAFHLFTHLAMPVNVQGLDQSIMSGLHAFFKEAVAKEQNEAAMNKRAQQEEKTLIAEKFNNGDTSMINYVKEFYSCVKFLIAQFKTAENAQQVFLGNLWCVAHFCN